MPTVHSELKAVAMLLVRGGWRNILEGPLFKTDSEVRSCCTLVWGPESLPCCIVDSYNFFLQS